MCYGFDCGLYIKNTVHNVKCENWPATIVFSRKESSIVSRELCRLLCATGSSRVASSVNLPWWRLCGRVRCVLKACDGRLRMCAAVMA